MGWGARIFALAIGFVFIGSPLWPVGVLSFTYVVLSFRPRSRTGGPKQNGPKGELPVHPALGALLLAMSAAALAAGGTASPVLFLLGGLVLLLWPKLPRLLPVAEVVPVPDSILLRSRYVPFVWHAIAELKPGAEPFPRAASPFEGTLIIRTDTGRAFSAVSCFAANRAGAEARLLDLFRSSLPPGHLGAFLLPLDSEVAGDELRLTLTRTSVPKDDLLAFVSRFSGVLTLECGRGTASRAGAYTIKHSERPAIPGRGPPTTVSPLTWEVLDAIGKRTRWPEADSLSNLIDTLVATRGVPIGERIRELTSTESRLTIQSLSGEEVQTSRPQFRALLSIYS